MKRNYKLTKHAIERKRERGFTRNGIRIALEWGTKSSARDNRTKVFFGIKECDQLKKELRNYLRRLDKLKGSTLIISERNYVIITLYKKHDERHDSRHLTVMNTKIKK